MSEWYQICTRCVMDTSAPEIEFDTNGVCSFCKLYDYRSANELHHGEGGGKRLDTIVQNIRTEGQGKPYDCLIGLSGGVDSAMVAYHVTRLGLRPLAIHLDNGWDSEVAVRNIERLVRALDIDLYTVVLDWDQFRDIQLAFLRSSVINSEVPTDHAIVASLFHVGRRNGIRHIISGGNIETEAIMPKSWGYMPQDWRHIRSIHRRFGRRRINGFPHLTLFDWAFYTLVRGFSFFPILNYCEYNKAQAKSCLAEVADWKDYGGKHHESIYTRFFQGYILPRKFGIDKRRAHLANLVCSGQITRDEALRELQADPYDPEQLMEDKQFVLKKLGLSESEFQEIMDTPERSYTEYPNNAVWFDKMSALVSLAKRKATHNR